MLIELSPQLDENTMQVNMKQEPLSGSWNIFDNKLKEDRSTFCLIITL